MLDYKSKLIKQCYDKSIELLKKNSTRYGIKAAISSPAAIDKRYNYIFGRDASICALGMIASGDPALAKTALAGLTTLALFQTKLGETPYSVQPQRKKSLFYYVGTIDSTLWWLIALDFADKQIKGAKLREKYEKQVARALRWLTYQDQNNCGLLEQGEASDWADDMPANGLVLYTNVLWYHVLRLYSRQEAAKLALDGLNNIFLPHQAKEGQSKYIGREIHRLKELRIIQESVDNTPYYLHYISYKYASDRLDVYANSLAVLFGVAGPARSRAIIKHIRNSKLDKVFPVAVLYPPIMPQDNDWRVYLDREECANKPYHYQNGGIWPYIGAFYAMALKKAGKEEVAWEALYNLARANKENGWEFNEWFDAKAGQAKGMPGQSWNAAMYVLAYQCIKNNLSI